jgi:hypothetical protein
MSVSGDPWSQLWLALGVSALALASCRSKSSLQSDAKSSAPVGADPAPAPPPARCRAVGPEPAAVIGKPEPRSSDAEDDDDLALPFASTVGEASAFEGGFALGAVRSERAGSEAELVWVHLDGKPAQTASLGRVFGDPEPPLVSANRDIAIVAVPDGDASGTMLRLASAAPFRREVRRGAEISNVDPAAGFALALGERGALLVSGLRGRDAASLEATRIDPKQPDKIGNGVEIAGSEGAEAPILVARSGGFFLAFAAEVPDKATEARKPLPDASVDAAAPDPDLIVAGPRALRVAALDTDGRVVGGVRTLSAPQESVGGFDAAALPDGGLLVAYRRAERGTGLEQGGVSLLRVGLDGSVHSGHVEENEPGLGVPRLLFDARDKRSWLSVRGEGDSPMLGIFATQALAVEGLTADPGLRGAELFALQNGRFLVGRARGRAMELSLLECGGFPPVKVAPAAPSASGGVVK